MAYTLKTSGIATNLVMCVAIDDDNTTIKEFVDSGVNSNKTLGTGVAASVASGSWKGSTRYHWSSFNNGGFDYHGVKFAASYRPTYSQQNSNGFTYFEAFHSVNGTGAGDPGFLHYSELPDDTRGGYASNSGKLGLHQSGGYRGTATTTHPTDSSTKFSFAASYDDDSGVGSAFYYGLESGSAATDGTSTTTGWAAATTYVFGIGGWAGQGHIPASRYVTCLFNRVLTLSEVQSLHDDWFGTLFDSATTALWKYSPVINSALIRM